MSNQDDLINHLKLAAVIHFLEFGYTVLRAATLKQILRSAWLIVLFNRSLLKKHHAK